MTNQQQQAPDLLQSDCQQPNHAFTAKKAARMQTKNAYDVGEKDGRMRMMMHNDFLKTTPLPITQQQSVTNPHSPLPLNRLKFSNDDEQPLNQAMNTSVSDAAAIDPLNNLV